MPAPDPGTILIVDDTPANLAFLSDALDQVGYKVLVAVDGSSALGQLERLLPDLILLDVLMPGLDGFETCRRLKGSERTREVPVVFMTALGDTADIVRGFEAGAVDYVTKPIRPQEVLARVATHLRAARVIRQLEAAAQANGEACVTCDRTGRVLLAGAPARRWFARYLGAELAEGALLPVALRRWLAAQPSPPWVTECDGRRLTIRRAHAPEAERVLLLLEEQALAAPTVEDLAARFALTPREAQVILWVAKGKTNRDIGLILGMSPRTVNKHLEHVYVKLGVETRTAAANKVNAEPPRRMT